MKKYYLIPQAEKFTASLEALPLTPLQKLQLQLVRAEKVYIDEEASCWRIDYRTAGSLQTATLTAAGKALAASFGVGQVHWHRLGVVSLQVAPPAPPPAVKENNPLPPSAGAGPCPPPDLSEADLPRQPETEAPLTEAELNEALKQPVVPKEQPGKDAGTPKPPAAQPESDLLEDEAYKKAYDKLYGAKKEDGYLYGKPFKGKTRPMSEIVEEENKVIVEGRLVKCMDKDGNLQVFNEKELRTKRVLLIFSLADETGGLYIKFLFDTMEDCRALKDKLKPGMKLRILGNVAPDKFNFDAMVMTPLAIQALPVTIREDKEKVKRVELHCHTKMSKLDGITPMTALVDTAIRFGHKALAITDHGVVQAFPFCYDEIMEKKGDLKLILGMEGYLISNADGDILREHTPHAGKIRAYHIIILVQNEIGLRNLYKLVSLSNINYLNGNGARTRPMLPREVIQEHREGLLLGSACEIGELYQAIEEGVAGEELEKIGSFYDYFEVQPIGNNMFLNRLGKYTVEQLQENNKKIYNLGRKLGKLTVATCDVHFLNPEDARVRAILQHQQGYKDADDQAPLFFRTTEEMLQEFAYFGKETAYELVVTNTNLIAEKIKNIKPVPDRDQLYAPIIPGAEEKIKQLSYDRAYELYGRPLPKLVAERLESELDSIINHGYAVLYYIAHKLVKKSLDDGYLVGSRGSVGSSFVATMTDITEVNPLVPHYRCPHCKHCEFDETNTYASGFDMPPRDCPECGTPMVRDGHNIPFAVFMGFHGDKVPDIDLNFSGDYQPRAHKYTEELFGRDNVCRAGTIATIAPKTAKAYVRKYFEDKNLTVHPAFIDSFIEGLNGVKRTTGQHPGGIMVIPRDLDIHYITPMGRPADDKESTTITTHYDYHSINDRLVKLDILGHDDPTVIKMLEDLTHLKARDIPIGDEETMSIFSAPDVLGVTEEQIGTNVGTYGIPECGTQFTRGMIHELQPKKFSEIVRVSGYSHGTDVWLNNAQELIREGKSKFETISTRDDVMTSLIAKGVEPAIAFKTMEWVRKGKAAKKGLQPEMKEAMEKVQVPEWYMKSCETVKYLFPKAHAVAYVLMAYRIAYCKVHYPREYYAAYFTVRAPDFDASLVFKGEKFMKDFIKNTYAQGFKADAKDKTAVTYLELAVEMMERGFTFAPLDLYKSDATKFSLTENGIRPPLSALGGIGRAAAISIAQARANGVPFISREDVRNRSKVSQAVIDKLGECGALGNLPESDQIDLFAF